MLVEVIDRDLPNVGKVGTQKDIPADQARVLILLGRVKSAVSRPRRKYRRKDVVAKAPLVVEEPPTVEALLAEPVNHMIDEKLLDSIAGESDE